MIENDIWFSAAKRAFQQNMPLVRDGVIYDNPGEWVEDTQIRLEIAAIHYVVDPVGWDGSQLDLTSCSASAFYLLDNYGKNTDCELNVFFIENGGSAGCAGSTVMLMRGEYNRYINAPSNTWYSAALGLGHEFGHSLGLAHSFSCCSNMEFQGDQMCPDETGTCNWCLPSDPFTGCHCTNNIMGYARRHATNHFSLLQIAKMHQQLLGRDVLSRYLSIYY